MKPMALALAAFLLAPAPALAAEPHETLPAEEVTLTGDSIYLLGGSYTDQEGRPARLEQFAGKPTLISMFYGTCPNACPMLISDLKRIEKAVPEARRKELQVVLVSIDPEHDTPASMKALMTAHQVDPSRWTLLRTDADKVQELAAVLGIKYRFAPSGAINHSTVITLLDARGVAVQRIEGLRQPPDPIVERLAKL